MTITLSNYQGHKITGAKAHLKNDNYAYEATSIEQYGKYVDLSFNLRMSSKIRGITLHTNGYGNVDIKQKIKYEGVGDHDIELTDENTTYRSKPSSSRRNSDYNYNKREGVRGKRFMQFLGWGIYIAIIAGIMYILDNEFTEFKNENFDILQPILVGGIGICLIVGFVRFIGFVINR